MKTISATDLLALLKSTTSSFVSFVTETDPSFKKGGRSGVAKFEDACKRDPSKYSKVTKFVALVGTKVDYGTLCENRAEKSGNGAESFVEKPRTWGERVDGVEVTHKGESYITCHFVANNKPEVSYKYEGKEITLTDVEKSYLPEKKISSSQADAGLTEANQIVHREYSLSSIKAVTIKGETYIVV